MNQQAMPSAPSLRTSPVLGWKTSTPFTLTRTCPSSRLKIGDVRLAEDDEQIALAGILQFVGHVQIGVHAGLQHGDAAQLAELGGVGLVVEGAGDQHVEPGVARLAGGQHQVLPLDRAELRADEDGRPLLRRLAINPLAAFPLRSPRSFGSARGDPYRCEVSALGTDQLTGPGA